MDSTKSFFPRTTVYKNLRNISFQIKLNVESVISKCFDDRLKQCQQWTTLQHVYFHPQRNWRTVYFLRFAYITLFLNQEGHQQLDLLIKTSQQLERMPDQQEARKQAWKLFENFFKSGNIEKFIMSGTQKSRVYTSLLHCQVNRNLIDMQTDPIVKTKKIKKSRLIKHSSMID